MEKRKSLSYSAPGASLEASHICGACEQSFLSDEEYCSHVCPNTNFQPTEVEHQDALTGGRFSKIAEAAIARGDAKKEDEGAPTAKKTSKKG